MDKVAEKLKNIKKFYDPVLNAYQEEPINIEHYLSILDSFYKKVDALIVDNSFIKNSFNQNNILFEGAQGALLDLDHGSYPFVTSSNTISSNIMIGSGLQVIIRQSVFSKHTQLEWEWPFPSELFDEIGDYIAETGVEFGTVTKEKEDVVG